MDKLGKISASFLACKGFGQIKKHFKVKLSGKLREFFIRQISIMSIRTKSRYPTRGFNNFLQLEMIKVFRNFRNSLRTQLTQVVEEQVCWNSRELSTSQWTYRFAFHTSYSYIAFSYFVSKSFKYPASLIEPTKHKHFTCRPPGFRSVSSADARDRCYRSCPHR